MPLKAGETADQKNDGTLVRRALCHPLTSRAPPPQKRNGAYANLLVAAQSSAIRSKTVPLQIVVMEDIQTQVVVMEYIQNRKHITSPHTRDGLSQGKRATAISKGSNTSSLYFSVRRGFGDGTTSPAPFLYTVR